jgi:uncharacterized protein YecE (DUF72 family)
MNEASPRIGTSGWHYGQWSGTFYPPGLKPSEWLRYYAARLASVEINSSFYRLPRRAVFERWREETPARFVFAVKASRYITHVKKLRDSTETVPRFLDRADGLGEKLGVVLYQFPPGWKRDEGRLAEFLRTLPPGHRSACEFRNPTWFNDRVFDLLDAHDTAFCIHDAEGLAVPLIVTGSRAYVRLHGAAGMYRGSYGENRLEAWADRIGEWRGRTREIYVYFNNDEQGFAVRNALRLMEIMRERRFVPA